MSDIGRELSRIIKRVENGITAMIADTMPPEREAFSDIGPQDQKESKEPTVPPIVNTIMNVLYIVICVGIVIVLILAVGSARLSLCYNSYLGTSGRRSTLAYAALAFIFFPLYYPYYALMLNPVCLKRIGRR